MPFPSLQRIRLDECEPAALTCPNIPKTASAISRVNNATVQSWLIVRGLIEAAGLAFRHHPSWPRLWLVALLAKHDACFATLMSDAGPPAPWATRAGAT
jgi:hypothetical protein